MEVLVRNACTKCKGTRIVQNPIWSEFWDQPNAAELVNDQVWAWFRERGQLASSKYVMGQKFELLPDEEIACYNCEGAGHIEKWLDLAEFLALCPGAPR